MLIANRQSRIAKVTTCCPAVLGTGCAERGHGDAAGRFASTPLWSAKRS